MIDRRKRPDIRPIERIDIQEPQTQIMPNGIPLHVIHAGNEEVVRMDLLIHAGIWHQDKPLQALFTNRMLREGTMQMDSAKISERLDYYGAWVELTATMNCNILTLYSLNKYFRQTLAIVGSMIKEPIFPEKELRVTLNTNKQQFLVNERKVKIMAHRAFSKNLFGEEHPCGKFAKAKDYDELTSAGLKEFYDKHYHSDNCSIYLSGKVNETIIASIENEFGTQTWGTLKPRIPLEVLPVNPTPEKTLFVEQPTAIQSALRMGNISISQNNKDFGKLRVLTTLLGGYFGSRLMNNIREDKGYTYGIAANLMAYPHQSVLAIQTETANEFVEAIVKETYMEMERLQNEPVGQQELDMVKNYMLGEICRNYEGAFSLADAWIFLETAGLEKEFHVRTLADIQEITKEELLDLAQKYLMPHRLTEVVAGKKV